MHIIYEQGIYTPISVVHRIQGLIKHAEMTIVIRHNLISKAVGKDMNMPSIIVAK